MCVDNSTNLYQSFNPILHGPTSSVAATGGGKFCPPLKTIEEGIFEPCDEKTKYSVGNFRLPKKFWSQSEHACMHTSPYCMRARSKCFEKAECADFGGPPKFNGRSQTPNFFLKAHKLPNLKSQKVLDHVY